MNIVTDIQLCFATFSILFGRESTEGIEKGQITAMNSEVVAGSPVDYEESFDKQGEAKV